MGKINLLSFEVANLIAAGEVVDRPASAVKELLENAIDSGAHHISLEIQRGGVSFIRVADDGCGIERDDLIPAITRHSTSKIKNAEDLGSITTLGFRGEALAAISSVSRLRIYSKPTGYPMGAVLESDGGRNTRISEAGCREGTTVIVEDLFYNVPARRKFLKKDSTEAIAIGAVIEKIALSHPEISFKFISDGEIKFLTSGKGDLRETIWALFGRETAERSLPVDRSEGGIRISGFISEPDMYRSNRTMENFFINGRYIKSKTAAAALEQAYQSKIPSDKFPFCVLNIGLNPAAVDVNVHPAKLEVKFANEKVIFDAVYYAVLSSLEAAAIRPELRLESSRRQTQESYKNAFAPLDVRKRSEQVTLRDALHDDKPKKAPTAPVAEPRTASADGRTPEPHEEARKPSPPIIPGVKSSRTAWAQFREQYGSFTPSYEYAAADADADTSAGGSDETAADTRESVPAVLGAEGEKAPQAADTAKEAPRAEVREKVSVPDTAGTRENHAPAAPAEADNPNGDPEPSAAGHGMAANSPADDPYAEILSFSAADIPEYKIIGEAWNCYIIVEIGDMLLMIDKHAAHERIIFDELCRKMRARIDGTSKTPRAAQILVTPIDVPLSSTEEDALGEYADKISALGFGYAFEKKGISGGVAHITSIPDDLDPDSAKELFSSLASGLGDMTASVESAATGFFETRLWQASCKAAVKGGRIYDMGHIKWICDRLLLPPGHGKSVIRTCPHGRPVAFEIKKSSVDRQFARLV